jgi:hypothetical protein
MKTAPKKEEVNVKPPSTGFPTNGGLVKQQALNLNLKKEGTTK